MVSLDRARARAGGSRQHELKIRSAHERVALAPAAWLAFASQRAVVGRCLGVRVVSRRGCFEGL